MRLTDYSANGKISHELYGVCLENWRMAGREKQRTLSDCLMMFDVPQSRWVDVRRYRSRSALKLTRSEVPWRTGSDVLVAG